MEGFEHFHVELERGPELFNEGGYEHRKPWDFVRGLVELEVV